MIEKLRLPGFFLIHHDLLELAREIAIEVRGAAPRAACLPPGRGRGSSVSSIVCYLTGLSHVDPLEADLCLGRFLHDELTSLPDIDLDFPRDIRHELIPRIHKRYGNRYSALVAAFPTYRTRGSLRGLGKALGLPQAEIERVIRTTDRSYGEVLEERVEASIRESPTGARLLDSPRWRALLRAAAARSTACRAGSPSTRAAWSSAPIRSTPSARSSPPRWWAGRSCSGTRTRAQTPASPRSTCWGWACSAAVERTVDLIHGARGEQVDLSRIPAGRPRDLPPDPRAARRPASSRSRAARRCRCSCARGPRR